ncbi:MAG: tetrathionate reductase family octaheme c-type cytochrome [Rhodocyclaceae bacterium]|nr:tetrathionate reductase family octaheme c-type cytochrome [Rhodocyclaceae bacterium]
MRIFITSLSLWLATAGALPALAATTAVPTVAPGAHAYGPVSNEEAKKSTSTADHSKFKELQKDFKSGPEVTEACLSCHTEAAKQVHATQHWTWEFLNPKTNQRLGKKNVINNFCTAIPSNYEFCTACHVGYGWKDDKFDFTSEKNVDCLVCHEQTGTYKKVPGLAGHAVYKDMEFPPGSGKILKAQDLRKIAQSVGKTTRNNCGTCHFYGGGGDAVKHGDLDSSLKAPKKYLDVHMDKDGLNFSCGTCHATSGHAVPGSRYAPTAKASGKFIRGKEGGNPASCQSCHGDAPHQDNREGARLNQHAEKLACQVCHIPEYARGGRPTKMMWDWSTAGKLDKNGKPFVIKDSAGHEAYNSKKGDFRYESNVIPEYIWFNGEVEYTLRETKLDPSQVVQINRFKGSPDDGKSKVWPIKRFTGKQPYDVGHNQLVVFHTYGADDAAFWSNFDWDKALAWGMKEIGAEYSGKFAFVSTEMSWPITHMVAPKGDALSCAQCHQPGSGVGRLDKVPGLYLPGRSANPWLDRIGWTLALLTLIGVLIHGGIRIVMYKKRGSAH